MKHIFVGDIHGKVDKVEQALAMDGKKIFVGDFIDSYDNSVEQHKKCYDLFLEAHEKGDARACFGNHELSYLIPERHKCSGWDPERHALMVHYKDKLWSSFEPYIILEPDFLVSHAGLTERIWDNAKLTIETLPKWLEDGWKDTNSPVHNIGYCRGGPNPFGGIFWATFNEDFEPINGLTQVFGHTRQRDGIQLQKSHDGTPNFAIDCLDFKDKAEFLILDV